MKVALGKAIARVRASANSKLSEKEFKTFDKSLDKLTAVEEEVKDKEESNNDKK